MSYFLLFHTSFVYENKASFWSKMHKKRLRSGSIAPRTPLGERRLVGSLTPLIRRSTPQCLRRLDKSWAAHHTVTTVGVWHLGSPPRVSLTLSYRQLCARTCSILATTLCLTYKPIVSFMLHCIPSHAGAESRKSILTVDSSPYS